MEYIGDIHIHMDTQTTSNNNVEQTDDVYKKLLAIGCAFTACIILALLYSMYFRYGGYLKL